MGGGLEEQTAEEDADDEEHPAFRRARREPPTETASIRAGFRSVVAIFHFQFVLLVFVSNALSLRALLSFQGPCQFKINFIVRCFISIFYHFDWMPFLIFSISRQMHCRFNRHFWLF